MPLVKTDIPEQEIKAARGSVFYQSAGGMKALAPGSNGLVLTTGGAGADPSWTGAGAGSVFSVGLALPTSVFTISSSPVVDTGTLTGTFKTQTANYVFAGPTSGGADVPAFRALVGADLPNPSSSTKGGVESIAASGSNWINSISTGGVPSLSQPDFSDLSGTLALSQFGTKAKNLVLSGPATGSDANPTFRSLVGADLPNPSSSTLGGVQSLAAVASKWINQISTSGAPSATQPAFTDISGGIALAQLPVVGNNMIIANVSGGSAVASPTPLSTVLDILGSAQGDVLYRDASAWKVLAPGTNGYVLTTGGAAANPSWTNPAGGGTVTQLDPGAGIDLGGGSITTTGSIALAAIADNRVLANVSGGAAAPIANTVTAVLDAVGTTQGDILYRGASVWSVLAAGTNGYVLQSQGAGSTPQWAAAGGVTNVSTGIGLTGGPVTTTGTVLIDPSYMRGYIGGLTTSNNGVTPNTKLDISAGVATDDTNAILMKIAAGSIDCTTTGANALDAGSLAATTWYHAFIIAKTDGTIARIASTSVSSPTYPAGYTLKRRIGSFKTDGSSHIIAFKQVFDNFYWATQLMDVNVSDLGASATLYTLSVPTGVKVQPLARYMTPLATTNAIILTSPDETDVAPATSAVTVPGYDMIGGNSFGNPVLITNTSAQIRARASAASTLLNIVTRGWIDYLGRFD